MEAEKDSLSKYFFIAASALLLVEIFRLVSPFLTALAGAAALALSFHPLHVQLAKRLKLRRGPAAMLSTVCALSVTVAPLALTAWLLLKESGRLVPAAQRLVAALQSTSDPDSLMSLLPSPLRQAAEPALAWLHSVDVDPGALALEQAHKLGAAILQSGQIAARSLFFLALNMLLMVVTLFFAFRDGAKLLRWALQLVPMPDAHKRAIARRVYTTFQAVVVGHLAIAAIQGLVATAGYLMAGVSVPFLLGAATTMAAVFPGSFLVSVPVSLLVLSRDRGSGLFLLFWSVLVVGTLDNLLKPLIIGSRAKLPMMLLFFGILGAVRLYGALGLVLGPLLITAVLSFIDIYRKEYFGPVPDAN